MSVEREIKFSYNWNNKLDCKAFTTIRIYQPQKYIVGEQYKIYLKDKFLFDAQIISVKKFLLSELNEFISYIDTGYSIEECKKVIERMYKKVNFSQEYLSFILIKKENKQ